MPGMRYANSQKRRNLMTDLSKYSHLHGAISNPVKERGRLDNHFDLNADVAKAVVEVLSTQRIPCILLL